jgi:hypothetical protein
MAKKLSKTAAAASKALAKSTGADNFRHDAGANPFVPSGKGEYVRVFSGGKAPLLRVASDDFVEAFKAVAAERGVDSVRAALEDVLRVVPATSSLAQRKGELVEAVS